MKKIYALSLVFAIALSASAQLAISTSNLNGIPVTSAPIEKLNPTVMTIDTLMPPSFSSVTPPCDALFYYYTFDFGLPYDTGFVFGNNILVNPTEAAQKFSGTGTVTNVLVQYGYLAGTTDPTTAKVYNVNATNAPTTLLGTSAPISMGSLSTTGYMSYSFSPGVGVVNTFACAAVFPTVGDTVAVVSTKIGCNTGQSLSWTKYGGIWNNCSTYIGAANNMDLVILPIISFNVGIDDYPSSNGLTLMGAYPNPATTSSAIKYNIANGATVSIEMFDLTGKVFEKITETKAAGTHEFKFNTLKLAAGTYYYTINTGQAKMTSKFEVVK